MQERAIARGERPCSPAEVWAAEAAIERLDAETREHVSVLLAMAQYGLVEEREALASKYDGWYHPDTVSDTMLRVAVQDRYGDTIAVFGETEAAEAWVKTQREDHDVTKWKLVYPARGKGDYLEIVGLKA
jgi:hypothetical protein